MRTRSRTYVEIAVLSLLLNGIVQYGPAFANLERWIQIGTIGTLLLGGGLISLFRRDRILAARRSFASEWKGWNP